jgi:DNA-directed RNA polymerase
MPSIEPLKDWTGWREGGYWDESARISTTFVRDSHPDTEAAIRRAFRDGSMKQHVDDVNALQRVEYKINVAMLPVVDRFAGKAGKKIHRLLVAEDVAIAKMLGAAGEFFIPMNCDFRGWVCGVFHLSARRSDSRR